MVNGKSNIYEIALLMLCTLPIFVRLSPPPQFNIIENGLPSKIK